MGRVVDGMMRVVQRQDGRWVIIHGGREIFEDFATEAEAESWADRNIDDQMFCGPNDFSPPLRYRPVTIQ